MLKKKKKKEKSRKLELYLNKTVDKIKNVLLNINIENTKKLLITFHGVIKLLSRKDSLFDKNGNN